MHDFSYFITLTYAPEHLPANGTICVRDPQLFLKRIRKRLNPNKIRYFLVGEYGGKTQRPHYHAIVFSPCVIDEQTFSSSWGLGLCHVGTVSAESIQYVAGYVTKKLTRVNHDDTRKKEFILSSRRPGIGAVAIDVLISAISDPSLGNTLPTSLRSSGKSYPLGRFLTGKLCELLEIDSGCDNYASQLLERFLKLRSEASPDTVVQNLIKEANPRNKQISWAYKNRYKPSREKL